MSIAFDLGDRAAAWRFLDALQIVDISNNLGDAKSMATHPCTTTHRSMPEAERLEIGLTEGWVRMSVGLEGAGDLARDVQPGAGRGVMRGIGGHGRQAGASSRAGPGDRRGPGRRRRLRADAAGARRRRSAAAGQPGESATSRPGPTPIVTPTAGRCSPTTSRARS